jgi:hypothetical protein
MARTRYLKPGFFTNEVLADCGPEAMLAFAGLWVHADRNGRLEDRPRRLKTKILPYWDVEFEALLDRLHVAGFIERYEVQGTKVIQVLNFERHQRPHANEPSYDLPEPPAEVHEPRDFVDSMRIPENGARTRDIDAISRDSRKSSSYGSGSSNRGVQGGDEPAGFGGFWESYPRKQARIKAVAAFARHRFTVEQLAEVMAALERHKARWDDPRFIPLPATWLNQERWKDELPDPVTVIPIGSARGSSRRAESEEALEAFLRIAGEDA